MSDDAIEEIPLPPQDIIDQMIAQEPKLAAAKKAKPLVAALKFGRPWSEKVVLDFPFEWNDRYVQEIEVHRLTTQQIADVGEKLAGKYELMDIYAAMTDLPVEVLRGLEAGDGTRVTEIAYDFLPRTFRTESD